jgi:hypothetical protein
MVSIEVTPKLEQFAKKYVEQNYFEYDRSASKTAEKQTVGLIGEMLVHWWLKKEFPKLSKGADGGFDIVHKGMMCDVKTMERKGSVKPDYVNNVHLYQMKNCADSYVYASLNRSNNHLELCGWTTKQELVERAMLYKSGTVRTRQDGSQFALHMDLYEIKMKHLNPIETLVAQ